MRSLTQIAVRPLRVNSVIGLVLETSCLNLYVVTAVLIFFHFATNENEDSFSVETEPVFTDQKSQSTRRILAASLYCCSGKHMGLSRENFH